MDHALEWLILAQGSSAQAVDLPGWGIFLIVVAIFAVPFLLAHVICRALKLSDLSNRMGIVLLTAVLGVAPFAWHLWQGGSLTDALNLGIDLAGGTNLVFQAVETPEKEITNEVMDQMVSSVSRRINPSGTEEVSVGRVGADRIEVIVPGADRERVEQIKNRITRLGSLEFALLANQRDHATIIRNAQDVERDYRGPDGHIVASWRPVGVDSEGRPKDVSAHGAVEFREVEREVVVDDQTVTRPVQEFLVILPPEDERITGQYLSRVYQTTDDNASLAVGFVFNQRGSYLFLNLTSRNAPTRDDFKRRLAILLDGAIHSAPEINQAIAGSGIISGRFTPEEINELIAVLKAGALEVPINPDPISELSISPTLGLDVQEKGKNAIIIASMVVVVFMAVYYLLAGLIADLCLVLNIVLVLGAMALIDATFTLPGLAGIVLTIGMAVDANVLIFERIREESHRGSSLRMAIQNGFGRAFTTIVDANVTTLITAVVLYMIGTDQVAGFAVTLFIGIVMSMYTALFFGRLMFDILARKRWIKQVKMFSIVGNTRWDFLSKRMVTTTLSFALIIAGMSALVYRGDENLDIDFSGGTMVTFSFVEPQNIDEIRGILQDVPELGSATSLERLALTGEEPGADEGRRFRVRTKEQDIDKVRKSVSEALTETGHDLRRVTMDYASIGDIEAQSPAGNGSEATEGESAEAPAATTAGDANVFVGGHQVELTFHSQAEAMLPGSDESAPVVKAATVVDYISNALASIQDEAGIPVYDQPEKLIAASVTTPADTGTVNGTTMRSTVMTVKVSPLVDEAHLQQALASVQGTLAESPLFDEINYFDSRVAFEMQQSAVLAILASLVAIVLYIWFRFQRITFGLAAVAALVHDVLIVLGMVALAGFLSNTAFGRALDLYDFKINLPMIAAFLTIVGYSLNDTIVVFDRIREVRGKNPALTTDMVNLSLNQTLSRTILTSLTTFLVVAILYAIGGEGIHGFAFCLVIGVIVGTYSSVFVASPVLVWLMNRAGGQPGSAQPTA